MAFQDITGTLLAQAAITTGYTVAYTTPANTRTFVKDITFCNTTVGAIDIYLSLVPDGGTAGAANALYFNHSVAAYATFQWKGVQILNAAGTIQVKASATGCTVNASGGEAR